MIQDEYITPTEPITGKIYDNELLILESSLTSSSYRYSMKLEIDLNVKYNLFYIEDYEHKTGIQIVKDLVKNLSDIIVIHNVSIEDVEGIIENDDSENGYLFIDISDIDTMDYLDLKRLEDKDILLNKWEILI